MAKAPKDVSFHVRHEVLNPAHGQPGLLAHPTPGGTHPAVVIVVDRVQVPLQELGLRRDQHVTGQAVGGLYFLEEVLLANPC